MPTMLIKRTLFLPYMSDSAPISGDMTNWRRENSDPRAPRGGKGEGRREGRRGEGRGGGGEGRKGGEGRGGEGERTREKGRGGEDNYLHCINNFTITHAHTHTYMHSPQSPLTSQEHDVESLAPRSTNQYTKLVHARQDAA